MTPPAATTNRLLMPVIATNPTFWAKALCMKEPKIGAKALENISARTPLAIRFESTSVPTMSPTAIISAVVSVIITKVTISIDKIALSSKVGKPNANKCGNWSHAPELT